MNKLFEPRNQVLRNVGSDSYQKTISGKNNADEIKKERRVIHL